MVFWSWISSCDPTDLLLRPICSTCTYINGKFTTLSDHLECPPTFCKSTCDETTVDPRVSNSYPSNSHITIRSATWHCTFPLFSLLQIKFKTFDPVTRFDWTVMLTFCTSHHSPNSPNREHTTFNVKISINKYQLAKPTSGQPIFQEFTTNHPTNATAWWWCAITYLMVFVIAEILWLQGAKKRHQSQATRLRINRHRRGRGRKKTSGGLTVFPWIRVKTMM